MEQDSGVFGIFMNAGSKWSTFCSIGSKFRAQARNIYMGSKSGFWLGSALIGLENFEPQFLRLGIGIEIENLGS